jgi:hypothetical protein
MPQISKGDTFADSQQLTASRLNQLVDSATILVGAITDQTAIAANTLEATDAIIVSDSGLLRKATIGDVLGSNLPVTASFINGSANADVFITPNDAVAVTGKVFTSSNGITVAVSSVAHELVTGQVIQITASNTAYSGIFRITVISVDEFQYTIPVAVTAASGTCSYIRKATEVVNGNSSISGNQYVDGFSTVKGNSNILGNSLVNGTQEVKGQATFTLAPKLVTTSILPRLDYFVQTRTQSVLTSGWGGLQNLSNPFGTKIPTLDITFTPQKAGNKVVLTWNLFAELTANPNSVFLVTRTPNSGVGAGVPVALPDAVDAQNNTWSGVAVPNYNQDEASTPENIVIKIVDNNTLDVSCTYSLHFRASSNLIVTAYINRSAGSAGAQIYETGMSLGHAQEIYI